MKIILPAMKVILPASQIPIGSTVSKIAGARKYKLVNRLVVYDESNEVREITAYGDARFMVDDEGRANAVAQDKEIVWYVRKEELLVHLEGAQPC
jgi:hypothetical protein